MKKLQVYIRRGVQNDCIDKILDVILMSDNNILARCVFVMIIGVRYSVP